MREFKCLWERDQRGKRASQNCSLGFEDKHLKILILGLNSQHFLTWLHVHAILTYATCI